MGISQADPLINAPPLVTFTTVALGGFRGILADFLWLCVARLQQEGQYFELVQLADWITKLEPRFTSVWAYHAWNMAYNISGSLRARKTAGAGCSTGFNCGRYEGLVYNPGEPRLLYELGWLFQHKIGANMDQAHGYYKQAWAAEITGLLGGPRPDYGALTAAAPTRADLWPARACPRSSKPSPRSNAIPSARPCWPSCSGPTPIPAAHRGRTTTAGPMPPAGLVNDQPDPGLMREVEASYGPLDWRLPQAHTLDGPGRAGWSPTTSTPWPRIA